MPAKGLGFLLSVEGVAVKRQASKSLGFSKLAFGEYAAFIGGVRH